jgi:lytic murein transglycosylase
MQTPSAPALLPSNRQSKTVRAQTVKARSQRTPFDKPVLSAVEGLRAHGVMCSVAGLVALTALGSLAGPVLASEADAAEVAAEVAANAATFERCLQTLRGEAAARGVAPAAFRAHTAGLSPDMAVIGFLDAQPEFVTPIWDYLAGLVDDERVADGQARMQEWADTLAAIEARYAVDAAVLVAVWGVETNYGQSLGQRPLLRSLATLSCFGRRQPFFRGELFTALRIVEDGHVDPQQLTGSWAGAFGHTQFMPSTFSRLAVDFDGDGRRDLLGSIPDALASTANFLAGAGWQAGQPWGIEVRLPAGFNPAQAGRRNRATLAEWRARGLRRADGSALEAAPTRAGLVLPAGVNGPAFLTLPNFDALFGYNPAESYALAIAHLSDRLRGGAPAFHTPWPTDDPGLSRAQRRELQQLLTDRGYDIGPIDGILGNNTRRAIAELQTRRGLEADGRGSLRLLEWLRQTR